MSNFDYQARAILALANSSEPDFVSTTVAKVAGLLALPLEPLELNQLHEGRKVFPATALEVFFDAYRGYLGSDEPSARLLDAFARCSRLVQVACREIAEEESWRVDGSRLEGVDGFSAFVSVLGVLGDGSARLIAHALEWGRLPDETLDELDEYCIAHLKAY